MGSVWLAFRATARLRWRALVGLALLLGVVGGVVLTAAAGARRTDTAYPRLLQRSHAADVLVVPGCVGLGGFDAALRRLPQVASLWTGVVYELALPARDGVSQTRLDAVASPDGAMGFSTDRVTVVAGQLFNPNDPRAVMIDRQLAAQEHLRPGSTLRLLGVPSTPKTCPPASGAPGPQRPAPLAFKVSAVVGFDDLVVPGPGLSGAPRVLLSPAFWRDGTGQRFGPGDYAGVRLRPGASLASFVRRSALLARRYRAGPLSIVNQGPQTAATERAIRPEAVTLAAFAALSGLIALAAAAQLLSRQIVLDSAEFPILRALGMSRRRLVALSLALAGAVTVPGACVAVAVAIAASPLMPIGPARLAEPSPGVEVNVAILGAGLAATALLPLLLVAPIAWRVATRAPGAPGGTEPTIAVPASRLGSVLGAAGLVTGAIGVRLAFEPGRGRTAVPVRSALAATTVAVAAVTAAVIFGVSLIGLISNPHRYGQNWALEIDLQLSGVPAQKVHVLAAQPGVRGYAAGDYGQVSVDGQTIPAIGIDPLRGRGFVTLLAGKEPAGPGQIVLGERTLRALRLHVGQTVPVSVNGRTRAMRIAGTAVFALFSQATSAATDLGTGAAVAASVLSEPDPPFCAGRSTCYNFFLVRYQPGTDLPAAAARLGAAVTKAGCPPGICLLVSDQRPSDIRNYAGVRDTPVLLGVLLALLAVGTLTHVLLTSVRRRRRDLAVLKILGLRRSQVLSIVLWQSSALATVALILGLPLGIVAGRWSWALFAGSVGVSGTAVLPVLIVLAAIPVTLLLAAAIAAGPGWAAARLRPAVILRSE